MPRRYSAATAERYHSTLVAPNVVVYRPAPAPSSSRDATVTRAASATPPSVSAKRQKEPRETAAATEIPRKLPLLVTSMSRFDRPRCVFGTDPPMARAVRTPMQTPRKGETRRCTRAVVELCTSPTLSSPASPIPTLPLSRRHETVPSNDPHRARACRLARPGSILVNEVSKRLPISLWPYVSDHRGRHR